MNPRFQERVIYALRVGCVEKITSCPVSVAIKHEKLPVLLFVCLLNSPVSSCDVNSHTFP